MDKHLTRLWEEIGDLLWDQWSALGVAGRASGKSVPFVVDPEALLLATIRFGAGDGRLMAEVLDWLSQNGGMISLQRLKNLQTSSRVGTREGLLKLGSFMESAGFRNWKSLVSWASKVPVLPGSGGVFGDVELRGMSQAPDCSRSEAFLLRMRGVFGVSSRPEVLTWLLTHDEGYAAQISRDTGWFSKSVQVILNDLELANLVVSSPVGKRKVFSLNPRQAILSPSLDREGLCWLSQGPFYLGLQYVVQTLNRLAELGDGSESVKAIAVRKEMPMMNAAFRQAGMEDPFTGGLFLKGEALLHCFEEGVVKLLISLEQRSFDSP